VLERLIERGFVIRHPRRPGQKEERYEQVLGGSGEDALEAPSGTPAVPVGEAPAPDLSGGEPFVEVAEAPSPSQTEGEIARLDRLEADLLELKGEIARLREALGD